MLSAEERRDVLVAARAIVSAAVTGVPPAPLPETGVLATLAGAFVSIHSRGQLRGCIGHIEADQPLARVIARCALAAAAQDPRFEPVRPEELPTLDIEVSVLGPVQRVTDINQITIGRHGLIVEQDWRKGLLLPQVAVEHRWDLGAFLAQTCAKAGLPGDAWRKGAAVYRFEADVFSERKEALRRA